MKFTPNQEVVIARTNSELMDGITGQVIGISADLPGMTVYIVKLNSTYDYGFGSEWSAVTITEHCLDAV